MDDEMNWATQFECPQHGNMGVSVELRNAVTSRKTCLICEGDNEVDLNDAMLRRVGHREEISPCSES